MWGGELRCCLSRGPVLPTSSHCQNIFPKPTLIDHIRKADVAHGQIILQHLPLRNILWLQNYIIFLVISYLPRLSQYIALKFSNKDTYLWIVQSWFRRHIYFLLSLSTLCIIICYVSCLVISQEEHSSRCVFSYA